jgi:hypothetical protein
MALDVSSKVGLPETDTPADLHPAEFSSGPQLPDQPGRHREAAGCRFLVEQRCDLLVATTAGTELDHGTPLFQINRIIQTLVTDKESVAPVDW